MTVLDDYRHLLAAKGLKVLAAGMRDIPELHPALKPHQRDTVEFCLRQGRAAAFLDTGLGKTFVELEWSRHVAAFTGKPVLILCPLAVAKQTVKEGAKYGIAVRRVESGADVGPGINIANYERLANFDPAVFGGVVLDESSILKSFMGKTKRMLVEMFASTTFRLAATATPAPNDYMELGNHSEFLGVMRGAEMLTRWFVNDTADTGTYRLKGHAVAAFWEWVASWAMCVATPSDLGYPDEGYALPPLEVVPEVLPVDRTLDRGGMLFRVPDMSATGLHKEKRRTAPDRAARAAQLVAAEPGEAWVLWVDTDYEADAIMAALAGLGIAATEVRGSMSRGAKECALEWFSDGRTGVLVTKPEVAGFGLNWQHCARTIFVGPSYSYEQFYQAVRRFWRFGQVRPVRATVIMADTEVDVWRVATTKMRAHEAMKRHMFDAAIRARAAVSEVKIPYQPVAALRLPPFLERPA